MQYPRSRVGVAVVAVLAALLASMISAGPASAAPSTRMTSTEASYAASVVKLVNRERASKHLPPVRVNRYLARSADRHNRVMATVNVISHLLPGELPFNLREWAAGYHFRCWAGENIGVHGNMDRRAALALQKGMFDERPPLNGHRLNILNRHYTEVGVAVLLDKVNHRLWLTLDFGSRC